MQGEEYRFSKSRKKKTPDSSKNDIGNNANAASKDDLEALKKELKEELKQESIRQKKEQAEKFKNLRVDFAKILAEECSKIFSKILSTTKDNLDKLQKLLEDKINHSDIKLASLKTELYSFVEDQILKVFDASNSQNSDIIEQINMLFEQDSLIVGKIQEMASSQD